MSKEDLFRRLGNEEDNFVERKPQGVGPSELRQTLCAFANSTTDGRESVLFIGVADKGGAILGVDNTDSLQMRVREAADYCYPAIPFTSEVLEKDGKKIVAVVIRPSARRPHFAGPAYIRQGSESPKASEQVFKRLIYEHHDKCREIQRHLGKTITVFDLKGGILGLFPWEVTLLECTPHVVKYRIQAGDTEKSKSIEEVMVSFDDRNQRFALKART